jgi:nucleoside-diphosphate-sugar epimerase
MFEKETTMRIFMAGATGVLGRRVVPLLTGRGHEVHAVARDDATAALLHSQGAHPVGVDLFDPGAVAPAVSGSDAVLNLATAVPPTRRMLLPWAWTTTNRLRTEASRHLVDAALATGAARYVQEALAFVYADHGARWITEDTAPDVPAYASAALTAEAEARRFDAAGGDGVALRFGLFYSADSIHTRDLLTMARRGLLPAPGRADAYTSWVHVDDAATAVVAALDVPGGAYHVVDDEPMTIGAHAALIGDLVGRRVRRPPRWLAVGPLALQARSQRVSNRRLRSAAGWRPAYPSRREGLPPVVAEIDAPAARDDPDREDDHLRRGHSAEGTRRHG